ncbi:MAG: succinylglutamate desuccinylase/aspartoacylase family protein [Actinobacteria bacterium]|nr:succinylglutamate desuccinylase/aspartoacylase family protein [Actinomycetota bacterium]
MGASQLSTSPGTGTEPATTRKQEAYRRFPDGLSEDLLALDDRELLRALGEPTLIRVPGTGERPPRAISCLLHGDESTGYHAVLKVLRRRRRYPFDLYVVIGNVRAALADEGFSHRYLDDQEDFNRVWGLGDPTTSLRRAADGILAELTDAGIEALVDVHNNSGNNPFYAIATTERPDTLNLATLFTTTILYWDLGAHTLMEVLDERVATIAVECGLPDRPESLAFAVDGLRRYLGEDDLRGERLRRDFDMLGGLRKVHVRPEVRFSFGGELSDDTDFVVAADADVLNFVVVPAGHVLGRVHPGGALPLRAVDAAGEDVTDQHFRVLDGAVVTTAPITPVMMTRTVEAARKDCLFYVTMELPPPAL